MRPTHQVIVCQDYALYLIYINAVYDMLLSQLTTKALALFHGFSLVPRAKLLSDGTIIAFDQDTEELNVIRNGSLLIEDGQITAVFDTSPIDVPPGTEVIDCTGQTITPGFVDTRKHKSSHFMTFCPANIVNSVETMEYGADKC